ncbi:MAG TPA: nucleotide disphospho-sugar-binding domain-containing protein [Burkholderiaceae bacterium]|nr:nucleotide disphospho-sugar-binding domain-containing protein [Burkholderiaceae bacterium]
MRILIATAGSHGDVLPFIALGKELSRRGYEIYFYANPVFAKHVADAGLRFRPVSTAQAYASLFSEVVDDNSRQAFKRVAQELETLSREYYTAMKADLIPGQTAALGGSLLFAPRLLSETDSIPCITVHLAPSIVRSDCHPARLDARWIKASTPAIIRQIAWWLLDRFYDSSITTPLNKLRAELGLVPLKRIFQSWIHEADRVICLFPDWFATPRDDWPRQIVLSGFPLYDHGNTQALSPEVLRFIEAGSPPVGISAGTATANSHEFFQTSIAACKTAGLRAILLSPFSEHIPKNLPEGIIHVNYVPFGSLLPRLAAFVHHGGIGSTSQALRAGIPQLIRPVAYDQFDNSARAMELGVGRELLAKQYKTQNVAKVLTILTGDPAIKRRCEEVSKRFGKNDGIATAADSIEKTLLHSKTHGVFDRTADALVARDRMS